MSELIERYLRELGAKLPRRSRRRITAELRDHLSESVAAEVAAGIDVDVAEQRAIEGLGPSEELANAFADAARNGALGRRASVAVAAGVLIAVGAVLAIALVAGTSSQPARASTPRPVTREQAASWVRQNLPAGSTLSVGDCVQSESLDYRLYWACEVHTPTPMPFLSCRVPTVLYPSTVVRRLPPGAHPVFCSRVAR